VANECISTSTEFLIVEIDFSKPVTDKLIDCIARPSRLQVDCKMKFDCEPASRRARHGCRLPKRSRTFTMTVDNRTSDWVLLWLQLITDGCGSVVTRVGTYGCSNVLCFWWHNLQLADLQSLASCDGRK
jgi:hypothetical protein